MASIYYLSFQKAPPRTVSYGQRIAVAPTIYNDLREDVYEPCDEDDDASKPSVYVVLAWLAVEVCNKDGDNESKNQRVTFRFINRAARITWRDAGQAFRPVQVMVPSRNAMSRTTKQLRLALFVVDEGDGDGNDDDDDVAAERWLYNMFTHNDRHDSRRTIFVPVISAPVFLGNDDGGDQRSNSLVRLFKLFPGRSSAVITMEEQAGYDLEGHLWDAALHLVQWLLAQQAAVTSSEHGIAQTLFRSLSSSSSLRILELGAGTGLVSIALAVALSQSSDDTGGGGGGGVPSRRRISISATDLPSGMELLQRNVQANQHLLAERHVTLNTHVLDWDDVDSTARERAYDVIVIADCTYNPGYFSALCRAIRTNLRCDGDGGGDSFGRCLLAKKHRHVDEDALWSELQSVGLHVERIAGHEARLAVASEYAYVGWGLYLIQAAAAAS